MSEVLQFLQQRNSAPKLTAPGPGPEQLEQIFQAALRAPDHAWLRPWRFLTIEGERRKAFGEVLQRALIKRNPEADEAARTKALNAPLRAPLVVVVAVKLSEHPKVPHIEQQLSAGCAAQALMLGVEASGFAAIWRTGDAAFDRQVMDDLGLSANEQIIGFLYIGTRDGKAKSIPQLACEDFVSSW